MFVPTSVAKSPRIDPGAASSGSVAPITWRAARTASRPLQHHRHDRARGDEVDQLAEERSLGMLGVVAFGQRPLDGHVPQRDDAQALALEAGDDLAAQASREGVGLDKDQRSVHGFLWSVWKGRRSGARTRATAGTAGARRAAGPDHRLAGQRSLRLLRAVLSGRDRQLDLREVLLQWRRAAAATARR